MNKTHRNDTPLTSRSPARDAEGDVTPAGAHGAWGSCSAEPYWLEVAEELGIEPEPEPRSPRRSS